MATDILTNPIPESTTENKPETKKRRKHIPGIYERGNRYQIDATYKGIRIQERCVTFEMAEAALRKQKTLIDEEKYLDKKRESNDTLEQLSEKYTAFCEGKRQKGLKSKKANIKRILDYFGKEAQVSKISMANVEAFQTALSGTVANRKKSALKPASINRIMATLKHMLHKATEWSIVDKNAASGVTLYKENNRRLRYLTAEECQTLLDACPSITLRQAISLAINTGMRRGEILHLKWDNINLREGYIEILEQKNGERSIIPLNATAIEILRTIPRRLDSDYVFTGKIAGEPFCDLKRQFGKAIIKAKLQGVTFHILRHTCASHLVMAGVDLVTVREIMRHKSIEMTLRYAHLSTSHKKAAVDALGNALAAGAKNEAKTA
jgi:integrase